MLVHNGVAFECFRAEPLCYQHVIGNSANPRHGLRHQALSRRCMAESGQTGVKPLESQRQKRKLSAGSVSRLAEAGPSLSNCRQACPKPQYPASHGWEYWRHILVIATSAANYTSQKISPKAMTSADEPSDCWSPLLFKTCSYMLDVLQLQARHLEPQ